MLNKMMNVVKNHTVAVGVSVVAIGGIVCCAFLFAPHREAKVTIESNTQETREYETVTSAVENGTVQVFEANDRGLNPIGTMEVEETVSEESTELVEVTEDTESEVTAEVPVTIVVGTDAATENTVSEPVKDTEAAPVVEQAPVVETPVVQEPVTEAPKVTNNMPVPFYTLTTYDGKNGYFYPRNPANTDMKAKSAAGNQAAAQWGTSNTMDIYSFDDTGKVSFQSYWE